MGGSESIDKELIDYKNHERVGIYRHIQHNSQNFVEIVRELPNERVFQEWNERVKDVKLSMVGAQAVFLPVRATYHTTELCGSGGTLRLIFQEWENFLKDEIANRRKNQNFYLEEELWFILYSLVRVGLLYEGRNCKLGDLHPSNIIVTPQGFIRVITRDSFPLELTNFQKIVEEIKADVYLAPEEMDQTMIESAAYSISEPSRCDAFSCGVTLLETVTLENCSYLYIRNPLRISAEKLEIYTLMMKERYSAQLYDTVMAFLELNPNHRKGFLQIYEMLRPHEEKILDLQPFSLRASRAKPEPALSVSQSRVPEQGRSMHGSVKAPVSPPTQQYFGFTKRQ